jgi:hypothetical protein
MAGERAFVGGERLIGVTVVANASTKAHGAVDVPSSFGRGSLAILAAMRRHREWDRFDQSWCSGHKGH